MTQDEAFIAAGLALVVVLMAVSTWIGFHSLTAFDLLGLTR